MSKHIFILETNICRVSRVRGKRVLREEFKVSQTNTSTFSSMERQDSSNIMLEAKSNRKRAEVDLQLLSNRIALLRQEEQKAKAKITVTNERASQIIEVKKRNETSGSERAAVRMSREYAVKAARQRATREREDRLQRLERSKELLIASKVAMAEEKKAHSQRLAEISKKDKVKLEIEKRQKAEESRRRTEVIRLQRENEKKVKEAKIQQEYEERLVEETLRAKEAEALIAQLEAEEKNLLMRLRDSRANQSSAMRTLQECVDA